MLLRRLLRLPTSGRSLRRTPRARQGRRRFQPAALALETRIALSGGTTQGFFNTIHGDHGNDTVIFPGRRSR